MSSVSSFLETEEDTLRSKLLKVLPTGMFVLWTLYVKCLQAILKHSTNADCLRIPMLVGLALGCTSCFAIPFIHHSHVTWIGCLFHAISAPIAFAALVITTPTFGECFFRWESGHPWLSEAFNVAVPLVTWGIICLLTTIMHYLGKLHFRPRRKYRNSSSYHQIPTFVQ